MVAVMRLHSIANKFVSVQVHLGSGSVSIGEPFQFGYHLLELEMNRTYPKYRNNLNDLFSEYIKLA